MIFIKNKDFVMFVKVQQFFLIVRFLKDSTTQ